MSDIVIQAESLSKQYRLGVGKYRHDTLRDYLRDSLRNYTRA
jgi:hypothetical protein